MARDVADTSGSSLDRHPDFPEFFRLAREGVASEFATRYDRAVETGSAAAAERIQARIDELARQRAIVTLRSMVDTEAGRGSGARALARLGIAGAAGDIGAPSPTERRAPGQPSPLTVAARTPRDEILNITPDQLEEMLRNPPPEPATLGNPPPERNLAERAVEGSMGIDYSEPSTGLRPGARPPLSETERRDVFNPPPPPPSISPPTGSVFGFHEFAPETQADLWRGHSASLDDPVRNEVVGDLTTAGLMAAAGPISGVARNVAGRMLANPRTTAAGVAGLTTLAGTGETQQLSEVDRARADERTALAAQADARKRQEELQAALNRYDPARIMGLSPADRTRAVREIQEELRRLTDERGQPLYIGRVDGNWQGQTTAAAAARRAQIARELAAARTDLETATTDARTREARRRALERQGARDAAEANQNTLDRLVHRYSGPLGFLTGLVGGNLFTMPARYAATRGVNAANQARVNAANALLDRSPNDISGRFGGVNEFYRRGGERAPFRPAPTAAGGFTEVRPPPDAGRLYPPRAPFGRPGLAEYVHPADAAVVGSMGLGLGYGEISLERARRERDSARSENDGSRQAQERLALAEAQYDWANMRANIMRGAPLAYPLAAIPFRYRNPRPNVELGEREVHRLSRWRRRQ